MDHVYFLKDLSESIPHYRKIVLLVFLNKEEEISSKEVGFSKKDINR